MCRGTPAQSCAHPPATGRRGDRADRR